MEEKIAMAFVKGRNGCSLDAIAAEESSKALDGQEEAMDSTTSSALDIKQRIRVHRGDYGSGGFLLGLHALG
jgi:hypothetical protein